MAKRDAKRKSAPVIDAGLPKAKARPRGRPFPKGHNFGLAQRFKKGDRANPHGRPKSAEISKALRKLLASEVNLPRNGRTFAEQLVATWIKLGLGGNAAAISAIADRAEGRPNLSVSVDGGADPATEMIVAMHALYEQRTGLPISEEILDADGRAEIPAEAAEGAPTAARRIAPDGQPSESRHRPAPEYGSSD